MSVGPIVRRGVNRGLFAFCASFVVLGVPCLVGREDFDLEPLAALTIAAAVMAFDYWDLAREFIRRRTSDDGGNIHVALAILLALPAAVPFVRGAETRVSVLVASASMPRFEAAIERLRTRNHV